VPPRGLWVPATGQSQALIRQGAPVVEGLSADSEVVVEYPAVAESSVEMVAHVGDGTWEELAVGRMR
jgi:hypothetical protein